MRFGPSLALPLFLPPSSIRHLLQIYLHHVTLLADLCSRRAKEFSLRTPVPG